MSNTIGRVDFIADLDGRNLPRKARQLGNQIGKEGGKGFSDSFDREVGSTFERKLTNIGESFANKLSKKGKLAGSKFSQDFEMPGTDGGTAMTQMQDYFPAVNEQQTQANTQIFVAADNGLAAHSGQIDALVADLKKLPHVVEDPQAPLANPLAILRSGIMMLYHLHKDEVAERVRRALRSVVVDQGIRTRDLKGDATTSQFADAILRAIDADTGNAAS